MPNAAEAGCDSIIFVNLNYISIDTSVINISGSLMAVYNGASYQWIDCNDAFAVLHNDTSQLFIPTKNGNYAVIISKDGCIDTSSCFAFTMVSNNEIKKRSNIEIYPNPTEGILFITSDHSIRELNIRIRDTGGKIIWKGNYSDMSNFKIDVIDFPAGIYFLELFDGKFIQRVKFIKGKI